MAQANWQNDWTAPPPAPPPLEPGDTFVTRLGPRRIVWPGVVDYFHLRNRRYRCEVVSVTQEWYRGAYGDLLRRCVPTVKVLPAQDGKAA